MATGGDDIDKLLRELDAFESTGAKQANVPAKKAESAPATSAKAGKDAAKAEGKGKDRGGRMAFAVVAAIVAGVLGAGVGMVLGPILGWLPLLDFGFWSTGLGAAFGGFLTALIAGPPRWFSD
jgi:F0F1-type ATP synthase assembly protein I